MVDRGMGARSENLFHAVRRLFRRITIRFLAEREQGCNARVKSWKWQKRVSVEEWR
ncbi:unnamed protein product, partial [Nesidiocoris tenuis]